MKKIIYHERGSECVVCGEPYVRHVGDTDHTCANCWVDEELKKLEQHLASCSKRVEP